MKTVTKAMASTQTVAMLCFGLLAGCDGGAGREAEQRVSSRSYKGHESDVDADNLIGAYPLLAGTRLDDCQTCHLGKLVDGQLAGSACDQCHDLLLHGAGDVAETTLNRFGLDYLAAGRTVTALEKIGDRDSDGDGFTNREELHAGRYPGSELSRPDQTVTAWLTVDLDELKALDSHRQFLLCNNTKQRFDDYATYTGVTIADLLAAREIDLTGATGITAIAPDGYMKSLPIEYVDRVFPRPSFHSGLGSETLGPDCGVVRYPDRLPPGLSDGAPIPGEHRLMLAYAREGLPLDPSSLDVDAGKITGEGPLRIVVPQNDPGMPDRGSKVSPTDCGDGFDFDRQADHNAGAMVRGVIAIRIDPMPAGVEEFDYMNGGWAFVEAGQLILYGHGVR